MSNSRSLRLMTGVVLSVGVIVGCEDLGTDTAPGPPTGAQSTLGKAKEKADRTVDQINQYQQDLSRQADTVFDDQAARQLEAERRAANGGD